MHSGASCCRPSAGPDPTPAEQRDHFARLLAYATGPRRAQFVAATAVALSRKALDGAFDDAWTPRVEGKGRRERLVPMPARLMQALADSLQVRLGPCTLQTAPVDTAFIGHLTTGRSLTPDELVRVYKRIFRRAAQQLECAYPGGAADLRRSSDGIRHTHASHALDAGSDLRDVQTNLGHASLSTTTLYTKGNDARRYQAVNAFFEDALSAGGV